MKRFALPTLSFGIMALCLLPLVAVTLAAVLGSFDTLARLAETVLFRYTWATLVLVVLVAAGAILIGGATAWLVTRARGTIGSRKSARSAGRL